MRGGEIALVKFDSFKNYVCNLCQFQLFDRKFSLIPTRDPINQSTILMKFKIPPKPKTKAYTKITFFFFYSCVVDTRYTDLVLFPLCLFCLNRWSASWSCAIGKKKIIKRKGNQREVIKIVRYFSNSFFSVIWDLCLKKKSWVFFYCYYIYTLQVILICTKKTSSFI